MNDTAGNSMLLWLNYALLLVAILSLFIFPSASLCALVALVLAYFARHRYIREERSVETAHAAWQVNTFWLTLLLALIAVIALAVIAYWMGSDPTIEARLNAITESDLPPQQMLQELWNIPGMKAIAVVCIGFSVLSLIWPLKRILQGIMALRAHVQPAAPGSRKWLALLLAVVLQLVPFFFL